MYFRNAGWVCSKNTWKLTFNLINDWINWLLSVSRTAHLLLKRLTENHTIMTEHYQTIDKSRIEILHVREIKWVLLMTANQSSSFCQCDQWECLYLLVHNLFSFTTFKTSNSLIVDPYHLRFQSQKIPLFTMILCHHLSCGFTSFTSK